MNKTTLIALAAVVVLGVAVYILMNTGGSQGEMESLSLPGLKPPEKEAAEGEKPPEPEPYPVDKVTVAGPEGTFVLERTGKAEWRLRKPVDAPAETYKVHGMLRAFDEEVTSNYAREVSPEALAKLGLDEESRIRVTLSQAGETQVDLFVGRVDKKDEAGGEADTMVMPADSEALVYYRIPGRDLRRPFEVKLDELRAKKVFEFKRDDIQRLEITDPRDVPQPHLVITRKALSDEEKATQEARPAVARDEFTLASPEGIEAENLGSYAASIASLRATEFLDKLPGADSQALDKAYRIAITVTRDGKEETHTLLLGAGRKKGVYARLEGREGVFLLSKYSADQLMKTLSDFRQKKLFAFKPENIEEIIVEQMGQPRVHVRRAGDGWTFLDPADEAAATSKVKSLASSLANFRAAEFLAANKPADETGLDAPALTVTAKLDRETGAGAVTLLVGKPFKDDKDQERYYAKLANSDEVFSIMRYSRENVAKTPADLRDERVFRVNERQIRQVTLRHPDQTLQFERAEKEGKSVWNMVAPEKMEDVDLTSLVATLASLDVEQVAQGTTPEAAGLKEDAFTVAFTLADGTQHAVTLSEEVEGSNNYASTSTVPRLQGQILLLSKYKVQNLTKKLPDFEK